MHVLWLFRFIVTIDLSVSLTLIKAVGRITIGGKKAWRDIWYHKSQVYLSYSVACLQSFTKSFPLKIRIIMYCLFNRFGNNVYGLGDMMWVKNTDCRTIHSCLKIFSNFLVFAVLSASKGPKSNCLGLTVYQHSVYQSSISIQKHKSVQWTLAENTCLYLHSYYTVNNPAVPPSSPPDH